MLLGLPNRLLPRELSHHTVLYDELPKDLHLQILWAKNLWSGQRDPGWSRPSWNVHVNNKSDGSLGSNINSYHHWA